MQQHDLVEARNGHTVPSIAFYLLTIFTSMAAGAVAVTEVVAWRAMVRAEQHERDTADLLVRTQQLLQQLQATPRKQALSRAGTDL